MEISLLYVKVYLSVKDLVYTSVRRSSIVAVPCFSPDIIALLLPDDKVTVGSVNRLVEMIPKKTDNSHYSGCEYNEVRCITFTYKEAQR